MTSKKDFNSVVLEATDDALLALGASVRHAVYYHIEKIHHVKHEEIPDKLESFHEALENAFGKGTKTIERLIANKLYSKLDLDFIERNDWTLVNYVRHAELLNHIRNAKKMLKSVSC
jgi:hypothetical protein